MLNVKIDDSTVDELFGFWVFDEFDGDDNVWVVADFA